MMHLLQSTLSRRAFQLLPGMMYALLLCAHQPAAALSTDYVACPSCEHRALVWSENEFDQVHLVAGASGTNNLHPQTLAVENVTKALVSLRYNAGGSITPLLDEASAANLARGITTALGKAAPQQDALFMVTSGVNTGLFVNKLGNSGRAFLDKNGLNIIFSEAHVDFIDRYRANKTMRPFDFGSRSSASKVRLSSSELSFPRNDWTIIPTAMLASIASSRADKPAVLDAAAKTMPAVHDQQYYVSQEERLKALKRLRDQNLISVEEYQGKRNKILNDW